MVKARNAQIQAKVYSKNQKTATYRKTARSTSNNQKPGTSQNNGISITEQSKISNVFSSKGGNQSEINLNGAKKSNGMDPKSVGSRSNKNIQKFQTNFPSNFNTRSIQQQNDFHGQSVNSLGSNQGIGNKLERYTANFGNQNERSQ